MCLISSEGFKDPIHLFWVKCHERMQCKLYLPIPRHSSLFHTFLSACLFICLLFFQSLYSLLVIPLACHLFSTFRYTFCNTLNIHLFPAVPIYFSWHCQCPMTTQYLGCSLRVYLYLAFIMINSPRLTPSPPINSDFLSSSVPTTPEKAGGGMKCTRRQCWLSQTD